VRSTAGSVENVRLLGAKQDGVQVAFVQGGIGDSETSPQLESLASLYFEPLWVFHRAELPINRLSDLLGKRAAVGPEGSGTRALALQILSDNEISAGLGSILPLEGKEAADALVRGEIDVAFFVISPHSSIVKGLLQTPGITLMDFQRAEAYTRIHHYLSSITLPEGIIDLKKNVPSKDIRLLAPATNLVASKELHPALIDLFLQAATEVHGRGGVFEDPNEFPSRNYLNFPLNKDARRHLKSGPPFLQRYLPFWAATFIDRLKVMLVPLITLLFPLFRIVPPSYRWRIRSKIFRWYGDLLAVDLGSGENDSNKEVEAYLAELQRIETEVMQVSVPLSYAYEFYALRLHIAYVRNKLMKFLK
jgi:hypothetical protein